jgi:hypothetical protein
MMPMPDVTVADVVAAAERGGQDIEVIVEVLRSRLKLGVIGVSHALGIDASEFIQGGTKRLPHVVAAADQVWADVVPTGTGVTLPDLGHAWETAAACRGKDPNLWFCDGEVCDAEIEAVAICEGCPAIGHCALTYLSEQDGLWAGMTHRNRARLRRYLRLGVVEPSPAAVAPVAVAIARSSLDARIMSRTVVDRPDGCLFAPPAAAAVVVSHPRRRTRAQAPAATVPLFA